MSFSPSRVENCIFCINCLLCHKWCRHVPFHRETLTLGIYFVHTTSTLQVVQRKQVTIMAINNDKRKQRLYNVQT